MQLDDVMKYLFSTDKKPYFLFISDDQYDIVKNELLMAELSLIRTSDFCINDDKLPDNDVLLERIKTAGINAKNNKFIVTGLGEYLAIRGNNEAVSMLLRLKNMNFENSKVILLLRGLFSQIKVLQTDPRFDNLRYTIIGNANCNLTFTIVNSSIGLSLLTGFKALLIELENGKCGNFVINTDVNFDNSLFHVQKINNAYDGIKLLSREFTLPYSCGNDINWARFLVELNQNNGSIDKIFEKHGFGSNLDKDLYTRLTGDDYRSWIYFITLKSNIDTLSNGYLRFVLEETSSYEDFSNNILNAIINVPPTDKRFASFYKERKDLVEKFPEPDIANFVVNNRKKVSESIYKLTDSTIVEREEIIVWISKNGLIPQLESIYPALAAYMKKYIFKCPELADLLTEYFEAYRRQKLLNKLESDFLEKVDELAQRPRKFNLLQTRNEIIDSLDKSDTCLYWLDALGVEYLSFIETLAQKRGLSISINIARAELPTITSCNRDFYDNWQGKKEPKNEQLDEIKHKEKGGYDFVNNELPIHLAKELTVIEDVIDRAATGLKLRQYKRFLIVSDHGASRLAVLRRKEEQYETDTKSEHSGRCCKLLNNYDLPFAAEENGYLVLADYGRFKGSRAANVEVHGGASFEEVIVPIIELSLKNVSVTVELVDEVVTVDSRIGTEIKLFINSPVQDVSIILNGKQYFASKIDINHYIVKLPDTKRAGDYPVDVYTGDDLIGNVTIKAQSKIGKINKDFDDLF